MNNFKDHLNFGKNLNDIMNVRKKLLEAYVRTPKEIAATAQGEGIGAGEQEAYRLGDRGAAGEKISPEEAAYRVAHAAESRMGQVLERSDTRRRQIQSALNMIPQAAYFGDMDAVHSLSRVLADINGVKHESGPTTQEDLRLFSMVHAGKYEPRRPQPEDMK